MRSLSSDSLEAIKRREGCKLTAYQDDGGVWTIGYGHTGPEVKPGLTITQDVADKLLMIDLAQAQRAIDATVTVPLSDNQFGALVSFVYNVGAENFKTSTLLKKLNGEQYSAVPAEMLKWVKVHGATDSGLINRRNSEGGQWVSGAFVRGSAITPDTPPPFWRRAPVVKLGAAVASAAAGAGSHVTAENVKSAVDYANQAAVHWHQFGTAAAILSAVLIAWVIFDQKKA